MSLSVLDELRAKSENVQKAGHSNTAQRQSEHDAAKALASAVGATPEQKIALETAKKNLDEAKKANQLAAETQKGIEALIAAVNKNAITGKNLQDLERSLQAVNSKPGGDEVVVKSLVDGIDKMTREISALSSMTEDSIDELHNVTKAFSKARDLSGSNKKNNTKPLTADPILQKKFDVMSAHLKSLKESQKRINNDPTKGKNSPEARELEKLVDAITRVSTTLQNSTGDKAKQLAKVNFNNATAAVDVSLIGLDAAQKQFEEFQKKIKREADIELNVDFGNTEKKFASFSTMFSTQLKKGSSEVDGFCDSLGGVPVGAMAAGAGLFLITQKLSGLTKGLDESAKKFIGYNKNIQISAVGLKGFSANGAGYLKNIKNEFSLTVDESMRFNSTLMGMREGTMTLDDIHKSLKGMVDTFGKVDPEAFKQILELSKEIPKEQMDIAVGVKTDASDDEKFNAIANLMAKGKIDALIDVSTTGGLGEDVAKSFDVNVSDKDKTLNKAMQKTQVLEEKMSMAVYDIYKQFGTSGPYMSMIGNLAGQAVGYTASFALIIGSLIRIQALMAQRNITGTATGGAGATPPATGRQTRNSSSTRASTAPRGGAGVLSGGMGKGIAIASAVALYSMVDYAISKKPADASTPEPETKENKEEKENKEHLRKNKYYMPQSQQTSGYDTKNLIAPVGGALAVGVNRYGAGIGSGISSAANSVYDRATGTGVNSRGQRRFINENTGNASGKIARGYNGPGSAIRSGLGGIASYAAGGLVYNGLSSMMGDPDVMNNPIAQTVGTLGIGKGIDMGARKIMSNDIVRGGAGIIGDAAGGALGSPTARLIGSSISTALGPMISILGVMSDAASHQKMIQEKNGGFGGGFAGGSLSIMKAMSAGSGDIFGGGKTFDAKTVGQKIGTVAGGAIAGAVTGAIIGSVVPGIGTVVGGLIGAGIGGMGSQVDNDVMGGKIVDQVGYRKAAHIKTSQDLHDKTNKSWDNLVESGFFKAAERANQKDKDVAANDLTQFSKTHKEAKFIGEGAYTALEKSKGETAGLEKEALFHTGGNDKRFSELNQKQINLSSEAYKKNIVLLNKTREEAIKNISDSSKRTMALNNIYAEEQKAIKEHTEALMNAAGNFNKLPGVMNNDLNKKLNDFVLGDQSSTGVGGNETYFQKAGDSLALSFDNINKTMGEFSKQVSAQGAEEHLSPVEQRKKELEDADRQKKKTDALAGLNLDAASNPAGVSARLLKLLEERNKSAKPEDKIDLNDIKAGQKQELTDLTNEAVKQVKLENPMADHAFKTLEESKFAKENFEKDGTEKIDVEKSDAARNFIDGLEKATTSGENAGHYGDMEKLIKSTKESLNSNDPKLKQKALADISGGMFDTHLKQLQYNDSGYYDKDKQLTPEILSSLNKVKESKTGQLTVKDITEGFDAAEGLKKDSGMNLSGSIVEGKDAQEAYNAAKTEAQNAKNDIAKSASDKSIDPITATKRYNEAVKKMTSIVMTVQQRMKSGDNNAIQEQGRKVQENLNNASPNKPMDAPNELAVTVKRVEEMREQWKNINASLEKFISDLEKTPQIVNAQRMGKLTSSKAELSVLQGGIGAGNAQFESYEAEKKIIQEKINSFTTGLDTLNKLTEGPAGTFNPADILKSNEITGALGLDKNSLDKLQVQMASVGGAGTDDEKKKAYDAVMETFHHQMKKIDDEIKLPGANKEELNKKKETLESAEQAFSAASGGKKGVENAKIDIQTRLNQENANMLKTYKTFISGLDAVNNSLTVSLANLQTELSTGLMDLAVNSFDPKAIGIAAEMNRKAITSKYNETKTFLAGQGEGLNKEHKTKLDEIANSTDSPAEKEKRIKAENLAFELKSTGLRNKEAQNELMLKKGVADSARKEYDAKVGLVNLSQEGVDIQKEFIETIGGPFESILQLEQQSLEYERQKADYAKQQYENLIKEKAGAEDIKKAKNTYQRAELEFEKKKLGLQRNAFEKFLGGIIGSYSSVGVFSGIDKAATYGAGYTENEAGNVTMSGADSNAAAAKAGINGYADRIKNINKTKVDPLTGEKILTPEQASPSRTDLPSAIGEANAPVVDVLSNIYSLVSAITTNLTPLTTPVTSPVTLPGFASNNSIPVAPVANNFGPRVDNTPQTATGNNPAPGVNPTTGENTSSSVDKLALDINIKFDNNKFKDEVIQVVVEDWRKNGAKRVLYSMNSPAGGMI